MFPNKNLISFLLLFSISIVLAEEPKKFSIETSVTTTNKITGNDIQEILKDLNKNNPSDFTEKELLNFLTESFDEAKLLLEANKKDTKNTNLDELKTVLIQHLKQYKVRGVSFCMDIDPNVAFFYDTINPDIKILYKDNNGNYITKEYSSSIRSIGIKVEATILIDLIFLINTDLNFYNSKNRIDLDNGIALNIGAFGGVSISYSSIKNGPGGILIVGIPIPIGLFIPGISYVMGGTLTAK